MNVAVVYGILSEPFGVFLGLLVVGVGGGWLIGNAIAYGTWIGKEHETIRALQYGAIGISVLTWIGALVLAYVISQILLPQASTPASARISIAGFFDYFGALDLTHFIHVIALVLMSFMAWRGAR